MEALHFRQESRWDGFANKSQLGEVILVQIWGSKLVAISVLKSAKFLKYCQGKLVTN